MDNGDLREVTSDSVSDLGGDLARRVKGGAQAAVKPWRAQLLGLVRPAVGDIVLTARYFSNGL